MRAGADPRKDQSYMLARLGSDELERLRFPVGELAKPRVRELARAAGLAVADKRESQDLCFLAGTGPRAFMRRHGGGALRSAAAGGEVVDRDGAVLGRHHGHHAFTVGQRRGIGVAASEPLYVLAKDAARNRVVVGPRSALGTTSARVAPAQLHRPGARATSVRLRYHAPQVPCTVAASPPAGAHGSLGLELGREVAAPAPGQTACLMDGELVVGWGTVAVPDG